MLTISSLLITFYLLVVLLLYYDLEYKWKSICLCLGSKCQKRVWCWVFTHILYKLEKLFSIPKLPSFKMNGAESRQTFSLSTKIITYFFFLFQIVDIVKANLTVTMVWILNVPQRSMLQRFDPQFGTTRRWYKWLYLLGGVWIISSMLSKAIMGPQFSALREVCFATCLYAPSIGDWLIQSNRIDKQTKNRLFAFGVTNFSIQPLLPFTFLRPNIFLLKEALTSFVFFFS